MRLVLNHSKPSYRPSPEVAQVAYEEVTGEKRKLSDNLTYLDIPGSLPEAVEAELVGDFGSVHGIGQVLLVGKDKEKGIT